MSVPGVQGDTQQVCPHCCVPSQQKEKEMLLHLLSEPEIGTTLNVLLMNSVFVEVL